MEIYRYKPGEPVGNRKAAIALGFFDGVHVAHRKLLRTAKEIAKKRGLLFAVFTFVSENKFKNESLLYSTEEKLSALESVGVEAVILANFEEISNVSAKSFIKDSLLRDMNCKAAVAGYDFRFGNGAAGDTDLLSKILSENGAECIIEEKIDVCGEKISTTKIKNLLLCGNVKLANEFLGSPYFIKEKIESGVGLGRKLGFPTVNTSFDKFIPPLRKGVYRTAVNIGDKLYSSVTNVGTCPTFDERAVHAETYIINFSENIYGEVVRVFFLDFLRDEKRFNSEEELISQIKVDIDKTKKENGDLKWLEIGLNLRQREK